MEYLLCCIKIAPWLFVSHFWLLKDQIAVINHLVKGIVFLFNKIKFYILHSSFEFIKEIAFVVRIVLFCNYDIFSFRKSYF